jgi:CRISPR-associated protein Csb2
VPDDNAELVPAGDRRMLAHYGIEDAAPARLWRTVTPTALSERTARWRIAPRRTREEAKGGSERLREHAAAEWAVHQALRHAKVDASVHAIRVQREPFESKGQRAEPFAASSRFTKERLWHVEIVFGRPVPGPLLIGDGRYLVLGLMAPVRRADGLFAFAIANGLADEAEPLGLARAMRRAVMARVQEMIGERAALPAFFTGHARDGATAHSGGHQHLAFAFDPPRKRLLIIAPHILRRREASQTELKWLHVLERALEDFCE